MVTSFGEKVKPDILIVTVSPFVFRNRRKNKVKIVII
jgi:hypothetical protein